MSDSISETVQDIDIPVGLVAMEDLKDIVCVLSNGTITNDLE